MLAERRNTKPRSCYTASSERESLRRTHRRPPVNHGYSLMLASQRRRHLLHMLACCRNRVRRLPRRRSASLSQLSASSASTAPQHHDHARTAGKEWSGELPPRSSSTAAGATTVVKPSPRVRLRRSSSFTASREAGGTSYRVLRRGREEGEKRWWIAIAAALPLLLPV